MDSWKYVVGIVVLVVAGFFLNDTESPVSFSLFEKPNGEGVKYGYLHLDFVNGASMISIIRLPGNSRKDDEWKSYADGVAEEYEEVATVQTQKMLSELPVGFDGIFEKRVSNATYVAVDSEYPEVCLFYGISAEFFSQMCQSYKKENQEFTVACYYGG